ncbi:secretory phospholipase A2 receptor [Dryobates pubescens]|uniref:secretory phospholipase A2 receptor n=1 Tax=Dryobates pubescens TaxID=118200 RepID=UPI0023B90D9F|nr:secretory phospholipase A2 receptor [Dryobates pubescens]
MLGLWLLACCLLFGGRGPAPGAVALSRDAVPSLRNKGIFIIQSEGSNLCIKVDTVGLVLEDCSQLSKDMLWKWVSNHRLFNIGRSTCLGLNISRPEQPLSMLECDSTQYSLRWDCDGKALVGMAEYKLAVESSKRIVAKKKSSYQWKQYMSYDEDLCEHPFQETYTLLGNSFGFPCVFPFKYNNKWYYECTKDGKEFNWCATTTHYEQDEKWGFCPNAESGCNVFWKQNPSTHLCYQFNLVSALTWREARAACQLQGGDLLSVTDPEEQNYISNLSRQLNATDIMLWMGLNRLEEDAGWQWSDGAPLVFVNWREDVSDNRFKENYCAVINSKLKYGWQSYSCESGLPFVCKKYLNKTEHETLDTWKYYATHCDAGWYPHNRNCYRLHKEKKSWNDALISCQSDGSGLISVSSLADAELLLKLLESENVTETWIGLYSNNTPVVFEWSDSTSVKFCNWHSQEPNTFQRTGQLCVSAQGSEGHWKVKKCEDRSFYICKKVGEFNNVSTELESSCPEGWERHGGYCYKIDSTPRSFEHASSGYFCPSALVSITNRFEQAFINSMIRSMVKSERTYFWIGLQDLNNTGEYFWLSTAGKNSSVSYTNWNKYEPRRSGGCVAMRGQHPVGYWEVKSCRNFKAMSLCKQKINSYEEPELTFQKHLSSCYFGWESEANLLNCYKIFHNEKILMRRTWEEAEELCQDFGAHLASFSHIYEETFLNNLLYTNFDRVEERQFWIGFNKRNWLSGGTWQWSDRTPVVSSFLESKYVEDDSRNCGVFKVNRTVFPAHCNERREWICKIPKGVKPKNPDWYLAELPWSYYQGAEYLFHVNPTDWETYEFVCVWLRSRVATINSSDEQAFIQKKIKKLSNSDVHWWIGLHADNLSDEFRWRDDSPVTYQNWNEEREREPQKPGKRCGFISSQTGLWGDENCTVSLPCICKRKIAWKIEKEIPKDQNQQGVCPKGWLHFGFKCFLIQIPKDPEHLRNWYSAQEFCSSHDGSLASLKNELEQAFITMNLFGRKTNVWIGFQSDDYEELVNANPPIYSNWSPVDVVHKQHHNNANIEEQLPLCTLVSNNPNFYFTGKWYLENCQKDYGFVCQKTQDISGHVINASEMYPVPDTLEYGNRMYKLIHGNFTWSSALKTCMANGTELVSITDQYHQAFLTVIVNRLGYNHWIGLFTSDNGLNFEWSDGSRSLFTFWEDDESRASGSCVYIDTSGHWKTANCEQLLQGAVCHVPPKKKPTAYKGLCSEKNVPWIKFKNSCYSFSTVLQGTSFDTAYEVCKNQGSNLLTIQDEDENAFILEELHSLGYSVQMIWLNILLVTDNETISWFDGSALNYSNWGIREPEFDHLKGNFCISLRTTDGVWQSSPCTEKKGFVCKMESDIDTTEPSENSSYHGIVALAVLVTLVMLVAISLFLWCLYRQNNQLFSRILWVRHSYLPQINADLPTLEESILISDFERSNNN